MTVMLSKSPRETQRTQLDVEARR
ncbi:MAG: hypothetical protein RLZZ459_1996, partial [Cyanobacteriota bacterium]